MQVLSRISISVMLLFSAMVVNTPTYAQQSVYDSLTHILETSKSDSQIVFTKVELGAITVRDSLFQALRFYENAIQQVDTVWPRYNGQARFDLLHAKARALIGCGIVNRRTGNFSDAIGFYSRAQEIAEETGDSATMSTTYFNLSTLYRKMDSVEIALKFQKKCLAIRTSFDQGHRAIVNSYNAMGIIYRKLDSLDQAEKYYQKALLINISRLDTLSLIESFSNLSVLSYARKEYEEAFKSGLKALHLAEQFGNKSKLISTRFNMAGFHLDKGKETTNLQLQERAF